MESWCGGASNENYSSSKVANVSRQTWTWFRIKGKDEVWRLYLRMAGTRSHTDSWRAYSDWRWTSTRTQYTKFTTNRRTGRDSGRIATEAVGWARFSRRCRRRSERPSFAGRLPRTKWQDVDVGTSWFIPCKRNVRWVARLWCKEWSRLSRNLFQVGEIWNVQYGIGQRI